MKNRVKVFSLEEANALLPELESLLAEFEAKHDAFQRLEDQLFFEEILDNTNPEEAQLKELEERLMALEKEIEKIQTLGCLLRHPERGWIDFVARRDKEWICYCWCRGEEGIQYYHSLRGGFFERQPLHA